MYARETLGVARERERGVLTRRGFDYLTRMGLKFRGEPGEGAVARTGLNFRGSPKMMRTMVNSPKIMRAITSSPKMMLACAENSQHVKMRRPRPLGVNYR
jgi:hypothetical protein